MKSATNGIAIRRLLARATDQLTFIFVIDLLVKADAFHPLLATALLPAFIPVDAFELWLLGTTLGKFLFRLRVASDTRLTYWQALKRSFLVWLCGQAAGIALLIPITAGIAYSRLLEKGITFWDEVVGTRVEPVRQGNIEHAG